jgi:predicted small metal-binding protein
MYAFSCDTVVPGCGRTFTAEDQQGILSAVARHAADDHGLTQISGPLVDQVIANTIDVGVRV